MLDRIKNSEAHRINTCKILYIRYLIMNTYEGASISGLSR